MTGSGKRQRGRIVYLNGGSSTGKGSLGRALQTAWGPPLFHLGVDTLFAAVHGSGYNSYGRRDELTERARAGVSWVLDEDGAFVSVEFGEYGRRLVRGLHASVAALASEGNDVVVDTVVFEPWVGRHAAETFASHDAFLVGLHCDRRELERREAARANRLPGLGEALATLTHEHVPAYDLELDSTSTPPEALAAAVVAHVRSESPRAFARWAAAEVAYA